MKSDASKQTFRHFETWKLFSMASLWQDFFIKVVFENILARSDMFWMSDICPPNSQKFSHSLHYLETVPPSITQHPSKERKLAWYFVVAIAPVLFLF